MPRGTIALAVRLSWTVALLAASSCTNETPAAARRLRFLELVDTLPRLEAEARAWPRSPSLACDQRAEDRAREIDALRGELATFIAERPAHGRLGVILEACDALKRCGRCGADFAEHCSRTRELLVDTQIAITEAGLK